MPLALGQWRWRLEGAMMATMKVAAPPLLSSPSLVAPPSRPSLVLAAHRVSWLVRELALAVALVASVACAGTSGSGGVAAVDAGADVDVDAAASGFVIDPTLCGLAGGLQAAMRASGAAVVQPVDLAAVAAALAVAGYEEVTAVDDAGAELASLGRLGSPQGARFVVGRDARHDLVAVSSQGAIFVATGCALTNLGVAHRLQEALAAVALALGPLASAGEAAATVRRWAAPAEVFASGGFAYWRQDIAPPDPNPLLRGQLGLVGAPAALALGIVGASDPGASVGDVIGVDLFAVGGSALIAQEKALIRGPGAMRWALDPALPAGAHSVDVDLLVTDASLRWQVGTWLPHLEALFAVGAEQGMSMTLQGNLAGPLTISKPIAALPLPAAVTLAVATAGG